MGKVKKYYHDQINGIIPTPMIDKARTEELTSAELGAATRELMKMANDRSHPQIVIGFLEAYVLWDGHHRGKRADYPEDALVAEADELLRLIAEEERAAS